MPIAKLANHKVTAAFGCDVKRIAVTALEIKLLAQRLGVTTIFIMPPTPWWLVPRVTLLFISIGSILTSNIRSRNYQQVGAWVMQSTACKPEIHVASLTFTLASVLKSHSPVVLHEKHHTHTSDEVPQWEEVDTLEERELLLSLSVA